VEIGGQHVSYKSFYESPLVVNGVQYPSLCHLLKEAEAVLSPHQQWGPKVFGLGDGHGGNVMIGTQILRNSSRELLYIDYEAAGFHSPILDITKPLFNDVFFNIFYQDLLDRSQDVVTSFEQDQIHIRVDLTLDLLSKTIFEIKWRYLLEPFCLVMQQHGFDLLSFTNMRKLASALLTCTILARNFSGNWNALFANIALGAMISQFTKWEDFEHYILASGKHEPSKL
jgi:hypothetical protein